MLTYPDINPVALDLGIIKVHWYGLMYLVALGGGWALGRLRARDPFRGWRARDVDDIVFYVALGAILGGRIGYILFYAPGQFVANPLVLFRVWEGGMSFHGGLLGTLVAMWWFARCRQGWGFFRVADFVAPLVPVGLGAGRLGNFINGNLWGSPSNLPWAMVFPGGGDTPRHPSQLYEAALEGGLLFAVLWLYARRPRPVMATSGLFLLGYGVVRFGIEFVRVPDAHIGYLAWGWLTMGHLLTIPMVVAGAGLLCLAYRRGETQSAPRAVDSTGSGQSPESKSAHPPREIGGPGARAGLSESTKPRRTPTKGRRQSGRRSHRRGGGTKKTPG